MFPNSEEKRYCKPLLENPRLIFRKIENVLKICCAKKFESVLFSKIFRIVDINYSNSGLFLCR